LKNWRDGQAPSTTNTLSMQQMRRYIWLCQKIRPTISKAAAEYAVDGYVESRRLNREHNTETYDTPRKFLSILRLATALAKLRLDSVVVKDDVREALRLSAAATSTLDPPPPRMS
jgi:DNA replication licensing factor MCM7